MRALVVEDDQTTRLYLAHVLEAQGFDVQAAPDGLVGHELFQRHRPEIVVLDIVLPGMDGIELLERIRGNAADTIVIVATAMNRPEFAEKALELGANNFLAKPVHHVDLVTILKKYASILSAQGTRDDVARMIVREQFALVLDNRLELVPKVADYLVDEAAAVLPDDALLGIRLGLVELLVNAVEHGNLGITFDEKTSAMDESENALDQLRRKRMAEPERAKRRVTVEYQMDQDGCEWVIRDEGEGFDWKSFTDRNEGDNWLACSGRGILLSRFQFDEMSYEGPGNVVRAKKFAASEPM